MEGIFSYRKVPPRGALISYMRTSPSIHPRILDPCDIRVGDIRYRYIQHMRSSRILHALADRKKVSVAYFRISRFACLSLLDLRVSHNN